MIRLLIPLLCAVGIAHAQSMQNYSFHLENGASVIYSTYSEVTLKDKAQMFGAAKASGNTIERTMVDGNNRTWLGFALHIDRIPGNGPIRFALSMEPLGGWGFFGQKAAPREIANGDRILLDVLEEPGTGRKIFDTFQVGIGVGMQVMPMTRTIPRMPPAGSVIHLQAPRLTQSALHSAWLGNSGASISGPSTAVAVAGKGRYSFSSRPEPGFRMEAIAEENRLRFVVGNGLFTIECSAQVMDSPGATYLWVRYEPAPDARIAIPMLELSNHE